MKLPLLSLATLVLISGVGAAAAADNSAMSKHSSMPSTTSSTASMAKDSLSLTTAQEKLALARPRPAGRKSACGVGFLSIRWDDGSEQYCPSINPENGCQPASDVETLSVCTASE